ncbi:hypothetical protein PF008_g9939 [Phytophthora fragariae]|uniref:SET domain-containing protein n=1 Tax=Phytophthora fragariae TaxID=53985 RepID=A0A6G0RW51_9STRA|nr:hypothetical protein PF008_g9939 [Phytophthora fragariae]
MKPVGNAMLHRRAQEESIAQVRHDVEEKSIAQIHRQVPVSVAQVYAFSRVGSVFRRLLIDYPSDEESEQEGLCGNGLQESNKIVLTVDTQTRQRAVIATETIEAGVVIGQYLGEIVHVHPVREKREPNNGYLLLMKTAPDRPTAGVRVGIDAETFGGMMRFVNYSCDPVAQLYEVANGRRHTIVVVKSKRLRCVPPPFSPSATF